MATYYDQQIHRFLESHQPELAGLLAEAYQVAGGHYATLTAADRRQQAAVDSFEFISDVVRGSIDRAAIQQMIGEALQPIALADDILRMVTAFEQSFNTLVQTELTHDPLVAQELLRRGRNLTASFRTNLTAAQVDCLLQQFPADYSYA